MFYKNGINQHMFVWTIPYHITLCEESSKSISEVAPGKEWLQY